MFYRIHQNNSGARYIIDPALGIGENIHIEADSSAQAQQRFDAIREAYGGGFDSYCECCGRRWWDNFPDYDATEQPETRKGDYIHYADGRIEVATGYERFTEEI